jgi:hypothetical protein
VTLFFYIYPIRTGLEFRLEFDILVVSTRVVSLVTSYETFGYDILLLKEGDSEKSMRGRDIGGSLRILLDFL